MEVIADLSHANVIYLTDFEYAVLLEALRDPSLLDDPEKQQALITLIEKTTTRIKLRVR